MKNEKSFLQDKVMTCPLCGEDFETKLVRPKILKETVADFDLRPLHEGIDLLKYDVTMCRNCGYATLTEDFKPISGEQKEAVWKEVSRKYQPDYNLLPVVFSYQDAIERYKYAMATVLAKKGSASEKAMICLEMGWVFRGQADEMKQLHPEQKPERKKLRKQEMVCLKKALDCFCKARKEESFPIRNMDDNTLGYLIAALAFEVGEGELARQELIRISEREDLTEELKDKIEELKKRILIEG